MKEIKIGSKKLLIKDYYCDDGSGYIAKDDGKLWLYVNISDICNGKCKFCINPSPAAGRSEFRIDLFREILHRIKDNVLGVSITGGEPMLHPELVDSVVEEVVRLFGFSIEIDMVTNGTCFTSITSLEQFRNLDSVHLSRHAVLDDDNDRVLGIRTVTAREIREVIEKADDPAKVVFNCVLMRGLIDSVDRVVDFLEMAAEIGVRNTSFIALSPANAFCVNNYVDPGTLALEEDPRFSVWNRFCDHGFCRCSSGSFAAKNRMVRYYYRAPGANTAGYARQLVYTADNRLLAGFGGKEITF